MIEFSPPHVDATTKGFQIFRKDVASELGVGTRDVAIMLQLASEEFLIGSAALFGRLYAKLQKDDCVDCQLVVRARFPDPKRQLRGCELWRPVLRDDTKRVTPREAAGVS